MEIYLINAKLLKFSDENSQSATFLILIGSTMLLFMMPFFLFELAVGFAYSSYIFPIIIITCSKFIGESLCFYLGKVLTPVVRPLLEEYKLFQAIELMT